MSGYCDSLLQVFYYIELFKEVSLVRNKNFLLFCSSVYCSLEDSGTCFNVSFESSKNLRYEISL